MRAHDLKIEDLLEFRPQEGKIFLKGVRTLLFNADALGTLRRDLIYNLGLERAKGFLIRYGWQIGYNDGISIKENFNWDNDEEALIAGSVLFSLEGFAKAENDIVNINRETKTVLKKGRFINSFEAEQHIRYFGLSDHSVCWLLIGYAGGYGSAFWGEKIYYKETKCKGKGDDHCEFEGKTLAQWGDDIEQELPFYEDRPIREELENAYERIQKQNKQLERGLTVHEELNKLVLRGEGLTGITETISRITNASILLFDTSLKTVVFSKGLDQLIINEIQYALTKYISNGIFSFPEHLAKYEELDNHIEEIKIRVSPNNMEYYCVLLPVIAGDDCIGLLISIHESGTEIDQESLMLLQRTTTIYAIEMMRQKQIFDLHLHIRADFMETLFTQKYANMDSFVAWGERLGQDILAPHHVLAMEIDCPKLNEMNSEEIILFRKEMLHATNKSFTAYCSSVMCVDRKKNVVILIPAEPTISKDFIRKMIKRTSEKIAYFKCELSFGVGNIVYEVDDYYKSYLQACKALNIIRTSKKKDRVLFFDELGSMSILLDSRDNDNLLKFMERKLKPVLDYDSNNNSDLITTLEHYLCTESIRKTAQITNLSLSGVKYRLNKLRDFGYDLLSPNERFEIQLAVKIFKIFR
ncbi:hypothetical protein SPSIL_006530 [Sporomusa silvacetica DSM 10669]|uniref:4-vinyl reductase 4VR domain-containing protein n=1 Tax=Sporomusa silvacetica DSM 10669 TaxID=1123289 RepID=A0ABZ3IFT7_9FIRM|nr:XylR N-terminal domain-containing protein [Sporomusa silvacetica]OZC17021.1 carbohydrate diacid transcriptional activator CdaR [Sporomusa silvacetica DSM 10669]